MLCLLSELTSHPLSHTINPNSICPAFETHTIFPGQKKEPRPGTQKSSQTLRWIFLPTPLAAGTSRVRLCLTV